MHRNELGSASIAIPKRTHANQTPPDATIHFSRDACRTQFDASDGTHEPFDIFRDAINTKKYSTAPCLAICRWSGKWENGTEKKTWNSIGCKNDIKLRCDVIADNFHSIQDFSQFCFSFVFVPFLKVNFVSHCCHRSHTLSMLPMLIDPKCLFPFYFSIYLFKSSKRAQNFRVIFLCTVRQAFNHFDVGQQMKSFESISFGNVCVFVYDVRVWRTISHLIFTHNLHCENRILFFSAFHTLDCDVSLWMCVNEQFQNNFSPSDRWKFTLLCVYLCNVYLYHQCVCVVSYWNVSDASLVCDWNARVSNFLANNFSDSIRTQEDTHSLQ